MSATQARLYALAEGQAGHFTTAQAGRAGVSRRMLSHYAARGVLERKRYGVYRLALFPAQRFEDFVEVALWAGDDAAISHESALVVYDLSDAMPTVVHVTVPRRFRGRRRGVVVHHAPLDPREWTVREDVPVTTVERTLLDVARSSDPSLARTAVRDALERGLTTVDRLEDVAADHPQERNALLGTDGAGT